MHPAGPFWIHLHHTFLPTYIWWQASTICTPSSYIKQWYTLNHCLQLFHQYLSRRSRVLLGFFFCCSTKNHFFAVPKVAFQLHRGCHSTHAISLKTLSTLLNHSSITSGEAALTLCMGKGCGFLKFSCEAQCLNSLHQSFPGIPSQKVLGRNSWSFKYSCITIPTKSLVRPKPIYCKSDEWLQFPFLA